LAPMQQKGPKDALLSYIQAPEGDPMVIYFNSLWVLIRDKYPKSSVHLLLLPRDPTFYRQHPFRAFNDAEFLKSARAEAIRGVDVAASELRRIYGRYSALEKVRIEAMELDDPPDELPPGRDWRRDIKVGVHAYPSMSHLHIHIFSADRCHTMMKYSNHYNTFNTDFFVPLHDFPLSQDDDRWQPERLREYRDSALLCWRCGKSFGRSMKQLKNHLDEELLEWQAE